MSIDTIITAAIAGLPVEIFVLAFLWSIAIHYIPANRMKLLKEFVTEAIQMVEQQYSGKLSSEQKKQRAGDAVVGLLKAAHLPVPPDSVISDLIESAVYLLNMAQSKTAPASNATQPLAETPPVEPLNLPKKSG